MPVMGAAARALLAGLVLVACACGTTSWPAANASDGSTKPSPSAVATPSNPPVVMPFVGMDFIDRSQGWEVTLAQPGMDVQVSRTSDGGATWSRPVNATRFYLADGGIPRFGVRFANADDGWVFAQGLFSSTDGGTTWTATPVNAYVFDVAIVGASVWALTDSGMFRSQAGSTSWVAMPGAPTQGPGPLQLIRISQNVAFIVQQAQFQTRVFRTADGGSTWTDLGVPCKGYGMPVATLDGVHLWMVCGSEPGAGEQQKSAYTSDDAGAHWTLRAYNDGTKSTGSIPITGYVHWLAVTGTTTALMANERGDVYRSTDGGRSWEASGLAHGSEGFYEGLEFVDASTGWFAGLVEGVTPDGSVGLYRTTDGGTTWTLMTSMAGAIA